jgi:hypothetical protein
MEVIVLLDGLDSTLLLSLGVGLRQSLGQTAAAVLGNLLQHRQLVEFFFPSRAVTPRHQPAADPTETVRLHDHQDRFAAHENLIGHGLLHAGPGVLVQHLQQRRGPLSSGLGPTAQFGNTGSALSQDDVQEPTGDRQADAGGLGRGGELGLAVLIEDHGIVEASLQVVSACLNLFELLAAAEEFQAVRRCVEVVADGVGLSVDGLTAESIVLGEACDRSVVSEEGSGGASEALGNR